MVLVSQGWAILPAPFIIEPEIEDACLRKLGLPGYDLRAFAIKKGLSQLVGAIADIEFKDTGAPQVSILTLFSNCAVLRTAFRIGTQ